MTFCNRSLPAGTLAVQHSSLKAHEESLVTSFTTDASLLEKAFLFAHEWADKFSKPSDIDAHVPRPLTSSSACMESKRADGGLSAYRLTKILEDLTNKGIYDETTALETFELSDDSDDYTSHGSIDEPDFNVVNGRVHPKQGNPNANSGVKKGLLPPWRGIDNCFMLGRTPAKDELLHRFALNEFAEMEGRLPTAQAVPVPERGLKCRVVTKSPAALVALGDRVRQCLFKSLERDARISFTLRGDHEAAVERAFDVARKSPDMWASYRASRSARGTTLSTELRDCLLPVNDVRVVSSDLSSASDLLPLDLVNALVSGLIEGLRWNRESAHYENYVKCLLMMTGP